MATNNFIGYIRNIPFPTFSELIRPSIDMRKTAIFLFLILNRVFSPLQAQTFVPSTEGWRVHGAYKTNNCLEEVGDKIVVGNKSALFTFHKSENSVEVLSRVNGLSDVDVQFLQYDPVSATLIIAYDNLNIDLMQNNKIFNIAELLNRVIIGDKRLNNISIINGLAYLSCSFGIVVIDIERKRLIDSYTNLGPNGTNLAVNDVAVFDGNIYAASHTGIYRASLSSFNLSDYNKWSLIKPSSFSNQMEAFNGKLFVVIDSVLNAFDGTTWSVFNNAQPTFTSTIEVNNQRMVATNRNNILIVNADGTPIVNPQQFANGALISKEGDLFMLVPDYFLIRSDAQTAQLDYIAPAGPYATTATRMAYNNGKLWIAGGSIGGFGVVGGWGPLYNNNKFYTLENNEWYNYKNNTDPRIVNGRDFIEVVIHPGNGNAVIGSLTSAIIEVQGTNVVAAYDSSNSTLRAANTGQLGNVQVSGIAFDKGENMWVSNFAAVNPLSVKTKNGQWKSFPFPLDIDPRIGFVTCDDYDQKWITTTRGQGLIVYNSGKDPLNGNDDKIKKLDTKKGNGFLPSNNVLCVTNDKEGVLWIGTDQGLCLLDRPQNVFLEGENYDARQIVIKTGLVFSNFLGTTAINCIRIDAANRKWIGTQNGVWLVSPDGYTVIKNFNMSNSPLLSNIVYEIGINEKDGEVFFATEKGLVSYMGTATEADDKHGKVIVFPNPVKPDYTGLITIRGLLSGAQVKITDINGQLVYETKANGGMATWDGINFAGKRTATGVYLIYSSNTDGTETNIAKLVFIN